MAPGKMAEYLSSHPNTEARIDELEKLAADSPIAPRPLASDTNWPQIRQACQ